MIPYDPLKYLIMLYKYPITKEILRKSVVNYLTMVTSAKVRISIFFLLSFLYARTHFSVTLMSLPSETIALSTVSFLSFELYRPESKKNVSMLRSIEQLISNT